MLRQGYLEGIRQSSEVRGGQGRYAETTFAAGLVTDAPAAEEWRLCRAPATSHPHCLAVQLEANLPVNGSSCSMLGDAPGPATSFCYTVGWAQNASVADIANAQPLLGVITTDLEKNR